MRTSALLRCAPEPARVRCRYCVLRRGGQAGRHRAGGTGRDGSDPPVRGPGTGSGPGVFAHTRPRPPRGVAPVQQSLAGRPSSAAGSAADQGIRPPGRSRSACVPWPARSAGVRGIEGGRATPRQPLPGTREAWPQGVCCSPAIAASDKPVADVSGTRLRPPTRWRSTPRERPGEPVQRASRSATDDGSGLGATGIMLPTLIPGTVSMNVSPGSEPVVRHSRCGLDCGGQDLPPRRPADDRRT